MAPRPLFPGMYGTPATPAGQPQQTRSPLPGLLNTLSPQERGMLLSGITGGAGGNVSNLLAQNPHAGIGQLLLAAGSGALGGHMQGVQGIQMGKQQALEQQFAERQLSMQEQEAAQAQQEQDRRQKLLASMPPEQRALLETLEAFPGAKDYLAPKAPDLTAMQRDAAAIGADLSTPEGQAKYQQFRQGLSRPSQPIVQMPGALDPRDAPLDPSDLKLFQMPDGSPLPLGTTYRQAQEAGAVPIDAAQAQAEQQAAAGKAAAREERQDMTAGVVAEEIGRALDLSNKWFTTGFMGGQLADLKGTPAHDLQQLTNTLKANVGFEQLQAMREASPTGGALGPVSDAENKLLQSVLGSLEQSQSAEQFQYNLKRLHNVTMDIAHGEGEGPARYDLGGASPHGQTMLGTGELAPHGSSDEELIDFYGR